MQKFEELIKKLNNSEEYIAKADIYEPLMLFINEHESLKLKINKKLNRLIRFNIDKLRPYLIDKADLYDSIMELKLNDKDFLPLLDELLKYEKRHML